jgi:hypothetical protein
MSILSIVWSAFSPSSHPDPSRRRHGLCSLLRLGRTIHVECSIASDVRVKAKAAAIGDHQQQLQTAVKPFACCELRGAMPTTQRVRALLLRLQ